jgi:hypothetical protein
MRADWHFIGSEDKREDVKVNLIGQTPFIARGHCVAHHLKFFTNRSSDPALK